MATHRCGFRLLLLAVILATALPALPVAAQEARCFPETGQCLSGRFRAYWENNGGLAVFGFPITPAAQAVNREDGKSYLTQWFERARFELHPDIAPPYDVLLGRLGDDLLRRNGVDWQARPHPASPQSGCRWFAQTAHHVCDQGAGVGFKTYWEGHGLQDPQLDAYGRSLALFGLPLSEAVVEISPTNEKPYLTQWFERARFEWHPDEPDPYRVLLGLVGNEANAAPASGVGAGARILSRSPMGAPIIAGNAIYWVDGAAASQPLVRYDLSTGLTSVETQEPGGKYGLVADDQMLAWIAEGAARVVSYDLTSGRTQTLIAPTEGKQIARLGLSHNTLFFFDANAAQPGIVARDLATRQDRFAVQASADFLVGGDALVWNDEQYSGGIGPARATLHLHRLDNSAPDTVIVQDQGEGRMVSLAGDSVAWSYPFGPVSVYSISRAATTTIADEGAYGPVVGGGAVYWLRPAQTGAAGETVWPVVRYTRATGARDTIATIMSAGLPRLWGVSPAGLLVTAAPAPGETVLALVPTS